jgi:hypothetical protein
MKHPMPRPPHPRNVSRLHASVAGIAADTSPATAAMLAAARSVGLARVRIRPLTQHVVLVDEPVPAVETHVSAVFIVRQPGRRQGTPQQRRRHDHRQAVAQRRRDLIRPSLTVPPRPHTEVLPAVLGQNRAHTARRPRLPRRRAPRTRCTIYLPLQRLLAAFRALMLRSAGDDTVICVAPASSSPSRSRRARSRPISTHAVDRSRLVRGLLN